MPKPFICPNCGYDLEQSPKCDCDRKKSKPSMTDFELQKAVAKKRYGYVAFKPVLDYEFKLPKEIGGIHCYTECAEMRTHNFLEANGEVLQILLDHKIQLDFKSTDPIRTAMETYILESNK